MWKKINFLEMNRLLLVTLALFAVLQLEAQGFAWGLKGGMTLGVQNWNGFEQDPLIKYHGILFIESLAEETPFALFAQGGYHMKGSAIRNRNFVSINNPNQVIRPPAMEFIFHNISLTAGAKQKFELSGDTKGFWLLGIRGDYTFDTNLEIYNDFVTTYRIGSFPVDDPFYIRNFIYGVTFGGGVEVPFSDLVGGVVELTVNPDLSSQYLQPEAQVYDPIRGTNRTVSEKRIRNITFEITIGFRFLRRIEYIDTQF